MVGSYTESLLNGFSTREKVQWVSRLKTSSLLWKSFILVMDSNPHFSFVYYSFILLSFLKSHWTSTHHVQLMQLKHSFYRFRDKDLRLTRLTRITVKSLEFVFFSFSSCRKLRWWLLLYSGERVPFSSNLWNSSRLLLDNPNCISTTEPSVSGSSKEKETKRRLVPVI